MPTPSIFINSAQEDDNNGGGSLKASVKSKPALNLPVPELKIVNDDVDGEENNVSSDDEDVMTAEEEAAVARRFLGGGEVTEQRR
ncbi:unnamed protein product [Trichobilharzia regenti]|nr:unnamed protein product [Trichobilharzia regenti]